MVCIKKSEIFIEKKNGDVAKKEISKKGKGKRNERETLHNCNMSGGAGKRARRGQKVEAEPIYAYDSDMCECGMGELIEISFVEISLYNFSPGQSPRAELSMWYREDDDAKHIGIAKKSWPVTIPTKHGEPIIAYDSDMFSEELGCIHECSRFQVKLYDFSPGKSAHICFKARTFPDHDDDESEPDESEPVQNSAKSAKARAALRALVRAKESASCMNAICDSERSKADNAIAEFEKQLDELDEVENDTEEYDDIIQTLEDLATFYKKKAVEN